MARLDDIGGPIPELEGFPRPDWAKAGEWLETQCADEDREAVATDLARQWLAKVKRGAGEGYEVYESDNFLILTSAGLNSAAHLSRVGERALKEMLDGLPGIAGKHGYGKLVCMSFADTDTYYRYISYFYREGEYGASGGVFISQGYAHFVLNRAEHSVLEFVLVHELTHACLAERRLPCWLEEGVTQSMEEAILGHSRFRMDRQEAQRHRRYWQDNGLRCFWLGESFHRPDEGMELSYALAQVLMRNLIGRGRDRFLRLLAQADPVDCGDGAVQEIYGLGIAELAAHFLGEGDWDWTPIEAKDFYYRALLHQGRGEHEKALADFQVVVDKGSKDPQHLNDFAWLLSTCPADDIRDGPKAVALATRACASTAFRSEAFLDTLAAAYAESGDFDNAVKWAQKAVERASDEHRRGDELRLELYREGKPYREDSGR